MSVKRASIIRETFNWPREICLLVAQYSSATSEEKIDILVRYGDIALTFNGITLKISVAPGYMFMFHKITISNRPTKWLLRTSALTEQSYIESVICEILVDFELFAQYKVELAKFLAKYDL
jgi:hypothetical protein